jgi:pimeloyl-ACP methyl ester carboxylesterase
MMPLLSSFLAILLTTVPDRPETHFVQVAPVQREAEKFERAPDHERAVVLIHGLRPSVFSRAAVLRPDFLDWQGADSALVKKLGKESDVYAFAYGQNVPADEVVAVPQLGEDIERLKKLGYKQIVLVGYSAGGLIARQFVEDYPDSGVTKVVQVCAPNGGSAWAKVRAVRSVQLDFLRSLTKASRRKMQYDRVDKLIPPDVEFVCVVGTGALLGDGVVTSKSQWTEELQDQGVPAYAVCATHCHIMHCKKAIALIDELVAEPQPRWDAKQLAKERKKVLGIEGGLSSCTSGHVRVGGFFP